MLTTLVNKYTVETTHLIRNKVKIEQRIVQVENTGTSLASPYLITVAEKRKALVCSCPKCGNVFNYSLHKFVDKEEYLCSKCTKKNSLIKDSMFLYNEKANKKNLNNIANKIKMAGITIIKKCQGNARNVVWSCQCSNGHNFDASPYRLQKNVNACPHCHYDSHEEYLYRILVEAVTGKTFEKIRPDWLQNPETGKNMELDMFNEELSIAFEYNGIHHYEPIFGIEKFKNVQMKDNLCINLAQKKGIKLYTVKYLSRNNISNIEFIKLAQKDLKDKGFKVTNKMCEEALSKAKNGNTCRNYNTLNKLKDKLKSINRTYVSGNYENGRSILQVRCNLCNTEKDMRATNIYSYVKYKYGCIECIKKNKKTS